MITMKRFACTPVATVVLITGVLMGFGAGAAEPAKPARSDFQHIEGRWVRPDGGYVLELKDIKKDGSLTAAYFWKC